MKQVVSADPLRRRVLANKVVRLQRGLAKNASRVRKAVRHWVAIKAARLRRVTLHRMIFIGITGSCGKTTTTLLTGAILSANAATHVKAFASTEPSIAGTLLRVDSSTRFCVHEVGAHALGSITRAVGILRPRIGVVTAVGTDHYRVFRGLEGVAREKAALVAALPDSGTAILNADDPHVLAMASQTRARILTFGISPNADIRATDISSVWPERLSLTVTHDGKRVRIQTQFVGEIWVTSILAAIACGIVCGVSLDDCVGPIETFEPVFARWSIHSTPGKPVFVLDSRKAPAWTLPNSLAFIERARAPRRTIVFGTLSDRPGGWTSVRYRKLAREALEIADRVVFAGPNAAYVDKMRAGEAKNRLFAFPAVYQASQFLSRDTLESELILLKGSISDHLERIMLDQCDRVVCWKQPCARHMDCPRCPLYRRPYPPPFAIEDGELSEQLPDLTRTFEATAREQAQ